MKSFVPAFYSWLIFITLWFVFAFQLSWLELAAGILASAGTVFAFHRSLLAAPMQAIFRLSWFGTLAQIPGGTVLGLRMLITALKHHLAHKPSQSVWQMIRFQPEGECDIQGGRRALAELLVTITPNSYVIDIDPEAGMMMTHTLENTPVPALVQQLESDRGIA